MLNLLFWFHNIVSIIFFTILIRSYYKNFVKKNTNTTIVKIKLSLILFIWSIFSLLGVILLVPRDAQNSIQEVCGMFWLADIAAFFVFVILEIFFLASGLILVFFLKNLNYSNQPISVFSTEK
jgi:Ni,Fe-hydrogenase I cytochrome b subunit